MAQQVPLKGLPVGTAFMHVGDAGTETPQPERLFRVVGVRASTVFVENGVGVRSTMSKKTRVFPLGAEVWEKVARPQLAAPIQAAERPAAEEEKKAAS